MEAEKRFFSSSLFCVLWNKISKLQQFNGGINLEGGVEERGSSVPALPLSSGGGKRHRDICSTRLQGAFTLMSACHHIQGLQEKTHAESLGTHTHTRIYTLICPIASTGSAFL